MRRAEGSWQTDRHEKGVCALYGNAGHRKDGDSLLKPSNSASRSLPSDAYTVLQSSCPQLTAEFGGATGTYCCDAAQVHDLSTKVGPRTCALTASSIGTGGEDMITVPMDSARGEPSQ